LPRLSLFPPKRNGFFSIQKHYTSSDEKFPL